MIQGYFDESGGLDQDPPVFCIAGYFLSSDSAAQLEDSWRGVLLRYEVPLFHMVDCAHGTGHFARLSKGQRGELTKELIDIIKAHTFEGFAYIVHADALNAFSAQSDIYSYCVNMAVQSLRTHMHINRIGDSATFFFEAGHKSQGRAYSRVAEHITQLTASITFSSKTEAIILQAADLLAWQSTKYVKDRTAQRRAPRKDFLSLMEHPHSMYHVLSGSEGAPVMAIEFWPLRRRSQTTAVLKPLMDKPITLVSEEGEDLPIMVVRGATGWRLGPLRMVYVALEDLGANRLVLAFDDVRLFETIETCLAATAISAENDRVLRLQAERIKVLELTDDTAIMGVTLTGGGFIAIQCPRAALDVASVNENVQGA